MANKILQKLDLKLYAMQKGVKMYQIAKEYGLSEGYFCKKMRDYNEFSEEEKTKIKGIIDDLASSKG